MGPTKGIVRAWGRGHGVILAIVSNMDGAIRNSLKLNISPTTAQIPASRI